MSFIDVLFHNLSKHAAKPLITEIHHDTPVATTGQQLGEIVAHARGGLRAAGVQPGDRAVLLAPNSARWAAIDIAILAEGGIVVPMYARQDPRELVEMMHDCTPSVVVCADDALANAITAHWADAPVVTFGTLLSAAPVDEPARPRGADDDVTIIYTSGSTGVPKGVVCTTANVDFMLPITRDAIARMMAAGGGRAPDGDDRVFHYLPFCFAGSRIVLWTCLFRGNGVMVSTDLDDLVTELKTAAPNYFLNVPVLLERIKNGVESEIRKKPRPVRWLYDAGRDGFERQARRESGPVDRMALRLAKRVIFDAVRQRIGANLRCLICGSAPLGEDTQRWFQMIGIPVYQVYGLTETTAIVSMDTPPDEVVPGMVGTAIPDIELKVGDDQELLVRGPNVFPRYWGRDQETATAFTDGWFRTGDQVHIDGEGRLQIVGRVKNLLVPSSGHNVAPEPIEQLIIERIEGVEQALVVGHGKPFLGAVITGDVTEAALDAGIEAINGDLPHYRRIRHHHLTRDRFTIDNGLLTANQKLRRSAIEARFAREIEAFYA